MIEFVKKIKSIGEALRERKESASVVYYVSFVYTFILLFMFIGEALGECGLINYQWRTPFEAVLIYFNTLSAYIFNKEILDRWISHLIWRRRAGEFLVLLWGLTLAGFFICEFFSEGRVYPPANMVLVFNFVLIGYIGSWISKTAYHRKYPDRKKHSRKDDGRRPTQKTKSALAQA